jgi:hypothetical protein
MCWTLFPLGKKLIDSITPTKKYPSNRMPSLIPRALAAVLAPFPTLPLTMPPEYRRTAPLTEIVIDSVSGPIRYIIINKSLVTTAKRV